ncbi:MAG: DUF4364 family protein [Oscillospiraceae bacterium]|jgi:hypothetical protein|nr:DUF4364 family protein [Oscillospiraceae bacterium]
MNPEIGYLEDHEVCLLICYLLKNTKEPLTKEELNEIFAARGLVNYFDLTNSLANLLRMEQLELVPNLKGETGYAITHKGLKNLNLLEHTVSKSMRDRAISSMLTLLAKKARLSNYKAEIAQVGDGFQVRMRLPDVGSDLMSLSLFVPDRAAAEKVWAAFLNDPQLLYKGIFAILTGDLASVGKFLKTSEEKLF